MIADGFIDILTFEDEVENLMEMNIKQLIQHKKIINELEEKIKNNKYYLTLDQQKKKIALQEQLDEDYDVQNAKNDIIKEEMRLIQVKERKFFQKIINGNNNFYIKYRQKLIEMIDMIIDDKKTYNHKEYMNEKITCECGCESYRKNLSTHKKSALHLRRLEKMKK
jgi:hypothetical protein